MEQTPVASIRGGGVAPMNAHLSADELSGMVDGGFPGAPPSCVGGHLAVCAACRAELVSASAIVGSAPRARPTSRTPWVARGMLAAAALLAILFVPRVARRGADAPPTELTRRGPSANTVAIVDPAPNVALDGDSVRLTWRAEHGASYRVTVTDSTGVTVFTTSTSDTVVVPPPKLRLVPGAWYFWYVEALRPDGSSAITTPSSFSIRRR